MRKLLIWFAAATLTFVSCAEAPEINIDKESLELDQNGGSFTFDVTSNCNWDLICDSDADSLLTISQKSGSAGTTTVSVDVTKNESTAILKHYFTAVAHGTQKDALKTLTVTQDVPAFVMFNKTRETADYIGGEYTFTVSSKFPWEITVDGDIEVEPLTGTNENGSDTITVIIPEYEGSADRSFSLSVTANGDDAVISDRLEITQTFPSLTIGNRTYKIKKMGDGRWWMLENLSYAPKGITIGDGICGIWYPCSDTANEPDNSTDGIMTKGLLYSDAAAFNTNITKTTCKKQEGTQGICPDGWHIPTADEFMRLVGKCEGDKLPARTDAPYYNGKNNKGDINKLRAAGFIPAHSGYIKGSGEGYADGFSTKGYDDEWGNDELLLTYFFSSSYVEIDGTQNWYVLYLNGMAKTANVDYVGTYVNKTPHACSIRCIKNQLE